MTCQIPLAWHLFMANMFSMFELLIQYAWPITCRICGGCNREIGTGNYLGCMGTFFHPDCFRCHACGSPITEFEVVCSLLDLWLLSLVIRSVFAYSGRRLYLDIFSNPLSFLHALRKLCCSHSISYWFTFLIEVFFVRWLFIP